MSVSRGIFKNATTFLILGVTRQPEYVAVSTFSKVFEKHIEILGKFLETPKNVVIDCSSSANMKLMGGTLKYAL